LHPGWIEKNSFLSIDTQLRMIRIDQKRDLVRFKDTFSLSKENNDSPTCFMRKQADRAGYRRGIVGCVTAPTLILAFGVAVPGSSEFLASAIGQNSILILRTPAQSVVSLPDTNPMTRRNPAKGRWAADCDGFIHLDKGLPLRHWLLPLPFRIYRS
jgi:hypothetical protein